MFGNFFGHFDVCHFLWKNCFDYFLGNYWKIWVTLNSNIWSHWRMPWHKKSRYNANSLESIPRRSLPNWHNKMEVPLLQVTLLLILTQTFSSLRKFLQKFKFRWTKNILENHVLFVGTFWLIKRFLLKPFWNLLFDVKILFDVCSWKYKSLT